MGSAVELVEIDAEMVEELVHVATTDTLPDEVTPPLTPGDEWTTERIAWLRNTSGNRNTLVGASGEARWAIVVDGQVSGIVRLKQRDSIAVLETGIWLARSVRGRSAGSRAIAAVLQKAWAQGATRVVADTSVGNAAAQGVLVACGFTLEWPSTDGLIHASISRLGSV